MPFYVKRVENEDDKPITAYEETTIEFEVFCDFEGSFLLQNIHVGLVDPDLGMAYFKASNVEIHNHSRFKAFGMFRRPKPFSPSCLIVESQLRLFFPTVNQLIHVRKRLPPFSFTIKFPGILLPKLWQKATLNLYVSTQLSSLSFFVEGLKYSPSEIILENGDTIMPTESGVFSYSNIPPGKHVINVSVFASKSGVVKIKAISNDIELTKSTNFQVTDYLNVNLQYRKLTKIAQIEVFSYIPCNLTIQNVEFFDESENNKINFTAFWLPTTVTTIKKSLLFVLDSEPSVADIIVQQGNLDPFPLRLKVISKSETDLVGNELEPYTSATPLVPENFNLL